MAVDVGSAVGYLDLDITGFLNGLKSAQGEADKKTKNIAVKIGNNMSNAGKHLTSAGSTLTKAVTVPIVGAGTAIIKMSSDFESAMSKVQAISGSTGDDMAKLTAKAKEMGAKTKFSATESAEAFTYMAMAGWKTEDMLNGIDGIMSLAAADGLDLATTSDIVTDAITAFGLTAEDSAHFADVLAAASSNANTNVSMLGESFKYAAPVAGSLGYSAEDTAIALGLMANAGIKGSQGGTALRGSLTRLIKPSDDAAEMMERYGISLTNADGSIKSLGEVMNTLRTTLGGLSEAEQAQAAATLFGQEAMSGMLAIVNTSDADFDKLTTAVYGSEGAAKTMSETMQNNFSGQLTQLKSSLEGLAIELGEVILPYFSKFVEWIQQLVTKFQELSPEQQGQVVKWAAIALAIGPVLTIVGKMTSGIGGIVTAFGNLSAKSKPAAADLGNVGSAAANASKTTKPAAASFGNLAGQALKLVAAGASLIMVGVAIKMVADSAIAVAAAGPGAAAAFVLLAGAGVGMTAAIVALGGASTATAPGLLSLGAAVLMVSGGIAAATASVALVVNAISGLVTAISNASTSLPLFAQYGGDAALALTELAGGIALVSASMLTLAASTATGLLPFAGAAATIGLVDVALAAMLATAGLASAGMIALNASLTGVKAQMKSINKSANESAKSLEGMVSSINIVDSFLSGLGSTVKSAAKTFIDSFSGIEKPVSTFGTKMQAASSVATAAMSSMRSSVRNESSAIVISFNSIVAGVTSMSSKTVSAFNAFVSSFRNKANDVRTEIKNLERAFSEARFEFNRDIKLPHFSMSGNFDPQTGSVPNVNVSWYRKAMASGMILNGATIFGFDSRSGSFLGGGEAGSEAVVGTSSLMRMIRMSVNASIMPFVSAMYAFIKSNTQLGYITRNVIAKQNEVISKVEKSMNDGKSGDTFNFYSPKPIDEIEAAKQMKKTKQDMAEGF